MKTIVLMGNIGCGKSSWTKALKNEGYFVEQEDLDSIRFLHNCWKDGSHALQTQIDFYVSWYNSYKKINSIGGGILDSSIISHHEIFSQNMLETNILTNDEFVICQAVYDAIMSHVNCYWVYLLCNFEVLKKRVHARNRSGEPNNDDVLKMFNNKMQTIVNKYNPIIVDISNMEATNPEDISNFLNILKEKEVL